MYVIICTLIYCRCYILNFMFPTYRPNFAKVTCTTQRFGRPALELCGQHTEHIPRCVPIPKQSILCPCSLRLRMVSSLMSFEATILTLANQGILYLEDHAVVSKYSRHKLPNKIFKMLTFLCLWAFVNTAMNLWLHNRWGFLY